MKTIRNAAAAAVYLFLGTTLTLALAGIAGLSIEVQTKHFMELVNRSHTSTAER